MDKRTPAEQRERKIIYQRIRRAKHRILQLRAIYELRSKALPKDKVLQRVVKKYYQFQIDKVNEKLNLLLMEYYSL